jgi:FkbM family methyltransferase
MSVGLHPKSKSAKQQGRALQLARAVVPLPLLMKLRRAFLAWEVINNRGRAEQVMKGLSLLVKPGDFVADIGANLGAYALELSRLVGPTGRVDSFEPILENFKVLETVKRKRKLLNVHLHRAAISSSAGLQEMVIPKTNGFSGFYTAHLARPGDDGDVETVEILTLDDLLRVHDRIDFMRAEVAGAELELIRGGPRLLTTLLPGVLLGIARRNGDEVFASLKNLGYRPFVFEDHFEEIRSDFSAKTYLYFFLHPESKCWNVARATGALRNAV